MPMDDMAPPLEPSVLPTVRNESNSEAAITGKNAGLTPPTSTPKGAGLCQAGGTDISPPSFPKIVYMFCAIDGSSTDSL